MRIVIETIPHKQQRYNTVGDWFTEKSTGTLRIRVSQLGHWRPQFLVAVHELVEAFACLHDGVVEEHVDKFDKAYAGEDEPGDDPAAPYTREHCLATGIERILAAHLGVQWTLYEDLLEKVQAEYDGVPKVNTSERHDESGGAGS